MEYIKLLKIKTHPSEFGTLVQYVYDAPPAFTEYVKGDPLFVEFPGDLSSVPDAILAVPFVGVMSTVTALLNIGITVPEIDTTFYRSLSNIEQVFRKMYPKSGIAINVDADRTQECSSTPVKDKFSLFFTGGVDATSALARTADMHPILINIWGGDLRLTDNDSHIELDCYLKMLTSSIHCDYCFIKTNAREMFKEKELGLLCEPLLGHRNNHGWWASIAHILSMASVAAPYLYAQGICTHYIASSYDPKTKTFDANNEQMIASIRFSSCTIAMLDSKLDRNAKVGKIIRYHEKSNAPINLKVCWQRTSGKNCCNCEKCYRTIMNIVSHQADPNDYGFSVSAKTFSQLRTFLRSNTVSLAFWSDIQAAFRANRSFWEQVPELAWFLDIHINSCWVYLRKLRRKVLRK